MLRTHANHLIDVLYYVKKDIELELSTTIGNGVLIISSLLVVIIGFIKSNSIKKTIHQLRRIVVLYGF